MSNPTRTCRTCRHCDEGVELEVGPNGHAWHVWPSDDAEPCNGRDRLPTNEARRDATIDAEQFTWYAVYQGPVGTWDACGRDVEEAQMFANGWSALVADGEGERTKAQIEYGLYAHAYESARKAARAAFRAVPALKEE